MSKPTHLFTALFDLLAFEHFSLGSHGTSSVLETDLTCQGPAQLIWVMMPTATWQTVGSVFALIERAGDANSLADGPQKAGSPRVKANRNQPSIVRPGNPRPAAPGPGTPIPVRG